MKKEAGEEKNKHDAKEKIKWELFGKIKRKKNHNFKNFKCKNNKIQREREAMRLMSARIFQIQIKWKNPERERERRWRGRISMQK